MTRRKRSKLNYYFRKYCIIPLKILRMAGVDTVRQDGVEHAGYLAFLAILSLFPFLMFLIMLIGLFGASEAGVKLVQEAISSIPKEVVDALLPRVEEIISGPPQSFLTIAIIGVIWTASSSVEGCRTILNRAYRVAFPPPYVFRRLISIVEFLVISFSIVIGVVIFIVLPSALNHINDFLPFEFEIDFNAAFFYLRHIAFFALLTLAVSFLYYALPSTKQKFVQTIPGSILTVTLWIILKKGFVFYLSNFDQFNFVYGSLAGMIASLMFFYLVSLLFILGAEFNYHFHRVYKVFLR